MALTEPAVTWQNLWRGSVGLRPLRLASTLTN